MGKQNVLPVYTNINGELRHEEILVSGILGFVKLVVVFSFCQWMPNLSKFWPLFLSIDVQYIHPLFIFAWHTNSSIIFLFQPGYFFLLPASEIPYNIGTVMLV